MIVVRELTGGIYFGDKQRHADSASDLCAYSVAEIERVVRSACRLARQRRGHVVSVDKANVLETSRLWREVATRVAREEFPDVTLEHQLVDSMAMHLLARPRSFDVIVTENMFGDILTDEASMLAGSLGRSEEHTSELQSLMRTSYAVFCLKKKNTSHQTYPSLVTISP